MEVFCASTRTACGVPLTCAAAMADAGTTTSATATTAAARVTAAVERSDTLLDIIALILVLPCIGRRKNNGITPPVSRPDIIKKLPKRYLSDSKVKTGTLTMSLALGIIMGLGDRTSTNWGVAPRLDIRKRYFCCRIHPPEYRRQSNAGPCA